MHSGERSPVWYSHAPVRRTFPSSSASGRRHSLRRNRKLLGSLFGLVPVSGSRRNTYALCCQEKKISKHLFFNILWLKKKDFVVTCIQLRGGRSKKKVLTGGFFTFWKHVSLSSTSWGYAELSPSHLSYYLLCLKIVKKKKKKKLW